MKSSRVTIIFFLHPSMRGYFLFKYAGRFFLCIFLPFGWGRSPIWFTKMMRNFVRYLRNNWCYRTFPYIDNFLVAPSRPGRASDEQDVNRELIRIELLMQRLGLVRKVGKGRQEGGRQIEHLIFFLDSNAMKVYVTNRKFQRLQRMSRCLNSRAHRNRRLVSADYLRHFCGVCVSLSLTVPVARFYIRSI